jgi:hypothetical protein
VLLKRAGTLVASIGIASFALIGMSGTASAEDKDFICDVDFPQPPFGELCLYSLPGQQGGLIDIYNPDFDLNGDVMSNGEPAANNAESAYNTDGFYIARAWVEANYTGASVDVPQRSRMDFSGEFVNNIESSTWILPPT